MDWQASDATAVRPLGRLYRVASSAAPTPLQVVTRGLKIFYADRLYGGSLKIIGTTRNKTTLSSTPVARKVALFDHTTMELVRTSWSNAAGQYSFENLANRLYFVVGFDHTGTYNGTIATNVRPTITGGAA